MTYQIIKADFEKWHNGCSDFKVKTRTHLWWAAYHATHQEESAMDLDHLKELSQSIDIKCYACHDQKATHLCRFKMGDMLVQFCLCPSCMQLDTQLLFERALGDSFAEDPPCGFEKGDIGGASLY